MRPIPLFALAFALLTPGLAPAQEVASEAQPPAPPPPSEVDERAALLEAAKAARDAAEASKEAAQALREALAPKVEAPAPAPAAEEKKKKGEWSSQLSATIVSVTGNADAVTTRLVGQSKGGWEGWSVEAKAGLAYGQTRPQDAELEAEVTAMGGDLRLRGDKKLGKGMSTYVLAGGGFDHVSSVEWQGYGEPGLGLVWFEEKQDDFVRASLRTDLGFRVTQESRFQYFPIAADLEDITIFAPRIAGDLRYALSKAAVFTWSVEVLPDVVDTDNLRLNSLAALTAQLAEGMSLQIGFRVRYVGSPAEGKQPLDTELATGISLSL